MSKRILSSFYDTEVYINNEWVSIKNIHNNTIHITQSLYANKGYGIADKMKLHVTDALYHGKPLWSIKNDDGTPEIQYIRFSKKNRIQEIYNDGFISITESIPITNPPQVYFAPNNHNVLHNVSTSINLTFSTHYQNQTIRKDFQLSPIWFDTYYPTLIRDASPGPLFYFDVKNKRFEHTKKVVKNKEHYYIIQLIPFNNSFFNFFSTKIETPITAYDKNNNSKDFNFYYRINKLWYIRLRNFGTHAINEFIDYKNVSHIFTGIYGLDKKRIQKENHNDIYTITAYDFSNIFNYILDTNHPRKLLSTERNKKDMYIVSPSDIESNKTKALLRYIFNSNQSVEKGEGIVYFDNIDEDIKTARRHDATIPVILGNDNTAGTFIIKKGENVLDTINEYLFQHNLFLSVKGDGTFEVLPLIFDSDDENERPIKIIHTRSSSITITTNKPLYTTIELLYPVTLCKITSLYKVGVFGYTAYTGNHNKYNSTWQVSKKLLQFQKRVTTDYNVQHEILINWQEGIYDNRGTRITTDGIEKTRTLHHNYIVDVRNKKDKTVHYPDTIQGKPPENYIKEEDILHGDIFKFNAKVEPNLYLSTSFADAYDSKENNTITYGDTATIKYIRNNDTLATDDSDNTEYVFQKRNTVYSIDIKISSLFDNLEIDKDYVLGGFFNIDFVMRIFMFNNYDAINDTHFLVIAYPIMFTDEFEDTDIHGNINKNTRTYRRAQQRNKKSVGDLPPVVLAPQIIDGQFNLNTCEIKTLEYNDTKKTKRRILCPLYDRREGGGAGKKIVTWYQWEIELEPNKNKTYGPYSDTFKIRYRINETWNSNIRYNGYGYGWQHVAKKIALPNTFISANKYFFDYYTKETTTAKHGEHSAKQTITISTTTKEKKKTIVYNKVFNDPLMYDIHGNNIHVDHVNITADTNKKIMETLFSSQHETVEFESTDDITHNTHIAVILNKDIRPPIYNTETHTYIPSYKRTTNYNVLITEKKATYKKNETTVYTYKGYIIRELTLFDHINDNEK